jgi:hypothetical protein
LHFSLLSQTLLCATLLGDIPRLISLLPAAAGLSRAARRFLPAALVALILIAHPASLVAAARAGRTLQQLNTQFTNPVTLQLLQPVVQYTQLVGNLGTEGITSQSLASAVTIDFNPLLLPLASPALNTPTTGPFLYVWNAYGNSYTDPALSLANTDFLAVVDLNKASPTYKKIIHVERLPTIGNEPHHISVSRDRTRLVGGGLLSFLRLQVGGGRAGGVVYA